MAATSVRARGHVAQLFGRDSAYLVLWAVQLLGAALFTPVLTRVLGPAAFGTVTSANAAMQIIFLVAGFGLQTAVQREYAAHRNPLGARRLLSVAIVGALAVSAVAWVTVDLWSRPLGMTGQTAELRLAVLWAGSSAVTNTSLGLLRSQDRLLAFGLVSLLQSVVAEGLSLTFATAGRPTAENFLWGQVAAQLAATGLGLCLAPPAAARSADRALIGSALRYALPLVPSVLSTFVLTTSDRLIVEAHLGSAAVARYQVAYNVAAMPMLLLSVLSSAWMPRLFGIADHGERHEVLGASRDALYRLMVPVVAGFAVGAPLVLRVWAPASYQPDRLQLVVGIVLITVVPFAGQLATSRTLLTEGRTGVIAAAAAAAAAANVVLNLVLIPPLGLTGSALATLLAYGLLHLMLVVPVRGLPVGPPPRRTRAALAAVTGCALVSAAVPVSAPALAVRGAAALLAAGWFVRVLIGIARPSAGNATGRPAGAGLDGRPPEAGFDGRPPEAGFDRRPPEAGFDRRPPEAGEVVHTPEAGTTRRSPATGDGP